MTDTLSATILCAAAGEGARHAGQDRIACGILYQREDIPDFYNRLIPRQGLETTCVEEVGMYDASEYWKELM